METLNIGILGLNRISTSMGLALKRYAKTGKYQFDIVGYDTFSANEKSAQKSGAIDRTEKTPEATVKNRQIVLMNLSYEDVRQTYRVIAPKLQEGAVILDMSPLKAPSYEWGKQYLSEEHHIIGFSPMVGAKYLYDSNESAESAVEDLLDNSTCFISPSVDSVSEAVDLAYNFTHLLNAKPRFLDATDFDGMTTKTEQLPMLLGVALYHQVSKQDSWNDTQWLTNPSFALFTRALKEQHPDALRDALMNNKDAMLASLDQFIVTLQEIRSVLRTSDKSAIEALFESSSSSYEAWLNRRNQNNWDKDEKSSKVESSGFMGVLFGEKIANKLRGKKD
jgi:prephenate dehydrogenase